jgi:hypothetical protein
MMMSSHKEICKTRAEEDRTAQGKSLPPLDQDDNNSDSQQAKTNTKTRLTCQNKI